MSMTTMQEDAEPEARLNVLVVDDDATLRNAYRRLLSRAFEVTLAASGEEALEILAGGARFDVLLVDLMMPRMDGTELHALIVERHPELDPRIVFVTGGETTQGTHRYMREHKNERIYKPFEPDELRALIHKVGREPAPAPAP